MRPDSPFVFVTVGTDHHPFDRLVGWVEMWASSEGARGVRCLVQSGTSRPPRNLEWAHFLTQEETMAALQAATVVVSHAGPGTVMSCRSLGLVPIVVPRTVALREHVDNHQVSFARRMADRAQMRVAESYTDLAMWLNHAVTEPSAFRTTPRERTDEAVARFEELVERLFENGRMSSPAWSRRPSLPSRRSHPP
jgi:UDP-N-acetylglucosamine transferase subunit ALG13